MACGTTQTQWQGQSGAQLDPKLGVFVAVPPDPSDLDSAGVGEYLAYDLAVELSQRGVSVGVGKQGASPDQNLAAARKQGAAYLIVANITDWQHHYTDIAPVGAANSAGFTLTVLKVTDSNVVRSDALSKSGSHASLVGGGDPMGQMKSAMNVYVEGLYPDPD